MTKTEKQFDVLEFKDSVQTTISQETKNMTVQEELAYFRKEAERDILGAWWQKVKARRQK